MAYTIFSGKNSLKNSSRFFKNLFYINFLSARFAASCKIILPFYQAWLRCSLGVLLSLVMVRASSLLAFPWPRTPGLYELPLEKFDRRKLDNYPLYLAEGKGALSVLLGETENELRLLYGTPDFRDYAAPEILRYDWPWYSGLFKLQNGKIISIKINFHPDVQRPTPWLTALGLHEEELNNLNKQEKAGAISRFYATRHQITLNDQVQIFSRGISFYFLGDKIHSIEIYPPRNRP